MAQINEIFSFETILNNKSSNKENILKFLADHVYLQSFDKTLVSIFVLTYYDDCNTFDIIQFFENPEFTPVFSISIGDNLFRFISLDSTFISDFKEVSSCEILYDVNGELSKLKESLINSSDVYSASNQLNLNDGFVKELHSSIKGKMSDSKDLHGIYDALMDYYICIINDNGKFVQKNYDFLLQSIQRGNPINFFKENIQLHSECLKEAFAKVNSPNILKIKMK